MHFSGGKKGFDYFAFSRQVISSEYPALLREKKIFVSLSSTLDLQYLSLIPLSVLAWRQLGVESLLCLVGKDENFLKNVKTVLEHVLTKNVTITLIKDFTLPSTTIAQMCRVFAATSESLNLHDDSIVITSDIDYIPFHLENHWREGFELFFYNSNCCQSVEFKEISLKMYPISTIAMKRSIWGKVLPYSEKVYNDPSKMEKYLYSIFGEEAFMNEDYRKGILAQLQPQWLFDQILISYKIKEFLERGESPRSGHEVVVKKRIDRAFWPSPDELHKMLISHKIFLKIGTEFGLCLKEYSAGNT
ncbi:unnamed protein product, partial [Mesorhabditis belari]|uniref:Uncharacterized protein n=1 Tax=Mesorhabditis belari TaxID=2138241 RepID=A0AAF3FII1_9BILA